MIGEAHGAGAAMAKAFAAPLLSQETFALNTQDW